MGFFDRFRSKRRVAADQLAEPTLADETATRDGVLGLRKSNPFLENETDVEGKLRAAANPEDDGAQTAKIEQERRDLEHGA